MEKKMTYVIYYTSNIILGFIFLCSGYEFMLFQLKDGGHSL
jgi:uncharacterized protein YybS (DUF2232 family)